MNSELSPPIPETGERPPWPQAEPLVARLLTARRALLYVGTTLPEQCSFDHSIPAGLKLAWGSFW